jgi:hypothetical protein
MARSKAILLVPLLGLVPLQAIACYTVYDRENRVVYFSDKPPVDMSRPLHETVPVRFPGGHLVFDSAACPPGAVALGATRATEATSSPLLTDERTARAMNARYRPLGRGVVMVEQEDARMKPEVNVLPTFRASARQSQPVQELESEPEQQPQPPQFPPRRY